MNTPHKYRIAKWACRLLIAIDPPLLWLMGYTWGEPLGYVLMGVIIISGLAYFDVYMWLLERRTDK